MQESVSVHEIIHSGRLCRLVEPTTNVLLTMPIAHPKKGSCLVDISMPHALSTFEGLDEDVRLHSTAVLNASRLGISVEVHHQKRSCRNGIVLLQGGAAAGRLETPLWLEAIPTSAAALSANAFVVGDAAGSIVVVEGIARLAEGDRPISMRIRYEGGPLSFPTSMATIPAGEQ